MKPIEQLADEHFNTLPVNGSHIWMFNSSELEALCKAYMQDRLKSLEPVAYFSNHLRDEEYGEHLNNVLMLDDIHNFDVSIDENMENYKKWVSGLKLYDISSLLEKE